MHDAESAPATPFTLIGGADAVAALVRRFYSLVESDPAYAGLRAMHGADLAPVRESLRGFLTGWLGGPRDWFVENPGKCMMSLHRALPITPELARQWSDAMGRAIAADTGLDPGFAGELTQVLGRMAQGMISRQPSAAA